MKALAIILARPTSGRLPKKHFRKIGDKSLMKWVLSSIPYDKVIATTKNGIGMFSKYDAKVIAPDVDENNTIGRVKAVSSKYPDVEYFFIVSGDCPLISGGIMTKILCELINNPEYDAAKPINTHHAGIEVVKASSISKLQDGEHFSLTLSDIKLLEVPINDITDRKVRITVDNMADLFFQNKAHEFLTESGKEFNYDNVLQLPNFFYKINDHVGQRAADSKNKTYFVTAKADNVIGLGHVSRAVALCQYYTECCNDVSRLFINDNPIAIDYVEKQGFIRDLDYFIGPPLIEEDDFDDNIYITDTPEHTTLDYYEIFKTDPTFAVNQRLRFVDDVIFSDVIVSFGKGAYRKFGEKIFNVLVDKTKYFLYNVDNVSEYIVGADRIITVFSQFAREVIFLGQVPECYAANAKDEELCLELHYKKYIVYKGRMN